MKITLEKNLAFGDQPKPILAAKVPEQIKPRKAIKPLGLVKVDLGINLPTEGKPKIEFALEERL